MELVWTPEAVAHFAHRGITLENVLEALRDEYLLVIDPDYGRNEGGAGVRQIGMCESLGVLVVMGYEKSGAYFGASAWKVSKGKKDYRLYWENRTAMGG